MKCLILVCCGFILGSAVASAPDPWWLLLTLLGLPLGMWAAKLDGELRRA